MNFYRTGNKMLTVNVKNVRDPHGFLEEHFLTEPKVISRVRLIRSALANTVLRINPPPSENAQKRNELLKKFGEMTTFVQSHPWLTSGFLLAGALLAAGAYLTVEAFLGHSTIKLFQAHPEINISMIFMCLNFSITLINICRRAYAKDELENKQSQIRNEIENNKKEEDTLENFKLDLLKKEDELNKQQLEADIKIKKFNELLEKSKNLSKECESLIGEQTATAIKGISTFASEGAKKLNFIPPKSLKIDSSVRKRKEKREIQERFHQKIQAFAKETTTMFKKSPGSIGILIGGLAMCLISGFAAYYMFHGATKMYFFGSLTVMTVFPAILYGLSTIYEAYNSAQIKFLNTEGKRLKEETLKKLKHDRVSLNLDLQAHKKKETELELKSGLLNEEIKEIKADLKKLKTYHLTLKIAQEMHAENELVPLNASLNQTAATLGNGADIFGETN